ncbi:hypothetical protein NL676_025805 [Syzygium grande]|nr:hypothetical protein NL676_025805 [Syzygium grande]
MYSAAETQVRDCLPATGIKDMVGAPGTSRSGHGDPKSRQYKTSVRVVRSQIHESGTRARGNGDGSTTVEV